MLNVYSVYDSVSEKFGNPFVAISDKVAIRDYNVGINGFNAIVKKDYSLVKIGYFDEGTGTLVFEGPVWIVGSKNPVVEDEVDKDE